MIVKMQADPISSWKSNDFVSYFIRKWREYHNNQREFPREVWPKYAPHIKRFMNSHNIKSEEYRDFVDWVFEFAKSKHKKYINFLATVDNRMWILYQRLRQNDVKNPHILTPVTKQEIERMVDVACSNSYLFPPKE